MIAAGGGFDGGSEGGCDPVLDWLQGEGGVWRGLGREDNWWKAVLVWTGSGYGCSSNLVFLVQVWVSWLV